MGQHDPSLETREKLRVSLSFPLGTTVISAKGYRWVKTEVGWELEHRLVMGLTKGDGLVAHHEDEDRANNHPDNLRVMTRCEHNRLHNPGKSHV